jgi:DNA helicase II / ATP-dependent DNA helicase PcrA
MIDISAVLEQNLTDEQRLAAIDPAAEVLTLACAGSGKSRTLAFRIAWLIAQGAEPASIVAFTFTEKAAESIKRRVADALVAVGFDPTILGAMYIGTIHSYCQYILGEIDARYLQFDVLDENKLKLFLLSRRNQLGLQQVQDTRNARYFETIRQVADAWKTLNDEMITIPEVMQYDQILGWCLDTLNTRLEQDEFIDFSLMIRLVVDALQQNEPRAEQAVSILRHLLVDEYQDVNPAQEALITELHRRSASLFVVGDDDQAIYGWRGANVDNILTFQTRYPNSSSHTLSRNYRSTAAIVQAADDFAAAELGAARVVKNPTADTPDGPRDFRVVWFDTRQAEGEWVASRIDALLGTKYIERDGTERGLTPADFAILMRSTRSQEGNGAPRHAAFSQALTDNGRSIPFSLESGGSIFDRPQVAVLRDAFELLRSGSPDRDQVAIFFSNQVQPMFPNAEFDRLTRVYAEWGRLIHAPITGTRRRVYPQQLVHDLLNAFGIAQTVFDDGTMQDIGMFSRVMQDVEAVYVSIDTAYRFAEILNFLQNIADSGYDTGTNDILLRPDAVTVSTVHKVKGLEFPVVFLVDAENERFPGRRRSYGGWLPVQVMGSAIQRGAYQSSREEEIRLFYTAITRAERYLYVSGCENLPGGRKRWRPSPFAQRLSHLELSNDPITLPSGLIPFPPGRRIEEEIFPTSFTDMRYYLSCPKDYQFRKMYGFSPPVPALFGYGQTIHTAISRLHQRFDTQTPTPAEARELAETTFHLKHLFPSQDPENNPGPYERAKVKAGEIVAAYAAEYGDDFTQRRQVEVRFEIPARDAVISGSIDLLLKEDASGEILDAQIIDFKTLEGGEDVASNPDLDWAQLALQVQLYAKAAQEVLGENAKTGAVHLLRDNQRVQVPIVNSAIESALGNMQWAVDQILAGDFPMRPHPRKCEGCDFGALCSKSPGQFRTSDAPPPVCVPGSPNSTRMTKAFDEFEE